LIDDLEATERRRLDLIHNERLKYTAASADRASTACYVISVLAPGSKLVLEPETISNLNVIAFHLIVFSAGVILSLIGRWVLGGLR